VVNEPCYHSNTSGSIRSMKVSVSLPEDDVEFLDSYAQAQGIESRSAALHRAVGLLRISQLGDAYEEAWASWAASDDASAWEAVTADGLGS
jgi:Arc/MetJ-type ribon-helix-helix transcriptional regulator